MQKRTKQKRQAAAKPVNNQKPDTTPAAVDSKRAAEDAEYQRRFDRHFDELKWLYT